MGKIRQSIELIRSMADKAKAPVVMISFGKDSMVMAHLIRAAFPAGLNGTHFPRTNGFPLPVIHHRDPWFEFKYDFANRVIRSWDMEVFDFLPIAAGVKANNKAIELVAQYQFGNMGIDLPKNVDLAYPRRHFICGLNDWLCRPKSFLMTYPWDLVFIGHKTSDVDPYEGPVPLKHDSVTTAGVMIVFPLRHWTDDDVWNYIDTHHIPYQETRYKDRKDRPETWYNSDYTHACTACIDPRTNAKEVFCPKLKRNVPNRGKEVNVLAHKPGYIG